MPKDLQPIKFNIRKKKYNKSRDVKKDLCLFLLF